MIHHTNQLDTQQLAALQQLLEQCKAVDANTPNVYAHVLVQERVLPASVLYYEQGQLIGFLGIYFFYEHAVELSVLVHPAYRRQGIATQLMQAIWPLLQQQQCLSFICSTSAPYAPYLSQKGFVYLHSEYYMACRELIFEPNDRKLALHCREACPADLPLLDALNALCFSKKNDLLTERVGFFLGKKEYRIMTAVYEGDIIGKAHIRWQEEAATLSDIAIHPTWQGQGFGSALIAACVREVFAQGKSSVYLDVETHNKTALNLYSRLGFVVQNACDFWSMTMAQYALTRTSR